MATEATVVEIDRERISELTEREEERLDERTPASRAMYERARKTLPAASPPRTRCAIRGRSTSPAAAGAKVWDVDGNELLDFHNGFGSMVQGHAHPAIGKAVAERYPHGTHFAAPTEDGVVVAEELEAPLGPAQVALHELGLRGDDGRDPDRARGHGPRHDREDLRLLPRPPRLRDGLDRRRVRPDRRPRQLRVASLRRRHPAVGRRPDDPGALQRRAPRWSGASSA